MHGRVCVSGKPNPCIERARWWLLLGSLCCGVVSTQAWGRSLGDLVDDPLFARPPVLDTGAVLPSDAQPIPCPARGDLAAPLALAEAVDLGLCNNPQVKATWAAIKIQAGAVGEARAAYLPTLTGSLSAMHTRNEFPDRPEANTSSDGHTVYLGLSWRLFDFGARSANREAANLMLAAAISGHDAALQKVLAAVVGAYFDALTQQAAMQARAEATRLARDTVEATERRERRGAAGQSDTLQARTAFAKAQLAEQRATADFRKALSALGYALGLPAGATFQLAELNDATDSQSVGELARWLDEAAARHPGIASARAQWDAAKARVDKTRAEGLPTVDFTANFYQNGYPNQGLQSTRNNVSTIGLTLTIPLFEGFSRTYKIRGAEAQAEQSEAQYEDTKNQILSDVIKVHADAVAAVDNLQASDVLIRSAQASMVSSEKRYAKGAADVLELLSTQSALTDAMQERVRCLSEWRAARLRLMATAGVLGRKHLDGRPAH
ncbi:TolC family protein [Ralstonia solanacearum]|uniref:TolC family protein n=1 Tax=Ralstonia solanacearum TaxID=305 RepID=UPI0023061215|nr:TolC family protein [Ralstonia solanacearum]MDB0568635.1 TolC family protein [Ralstonia solanacearum]MDB0576873.1 TolC family protein [Ralstonia solanacearum]